MQCIADNVYIKGNGNVFSYNILYYYIILHIFKFVFSYYITFEKLRTLSIISRRWMFFRIEDSSLSFAESYSFNCKKLGHFTIRNCYIISCKTVKFFRTWSHSRKLLLSLLLQDQTFFTLK